MRRLVIWAVWSCGAALAVVACGNQSDEAVAPGAAGDGAGGRAADGEGGAAHEAEELPLAGGGGGGGGVAGAPAQAAPGGEPAGGAPSPASRTVSGVVRAGWAAFPGVVVRSNGHEVTTAPDGSFELENAPDEYQLVLYVADYRYIRVYDGLRTRHPVLDLGPGEPASETRSATIQGRVSGGYPAPIPHDCWTDALYVSRTRGHLQSFSFVPPEPFELDMRWGDGGEADEGELFVLQTMRAEGKTVSAYTGYGKRAIKVSDGMLLGSLSGSPLTDVMLRDPEEYTVAGELRGPEGLTLHGDTLRVGGWRNPTFLSLGAYELTLPDVAEPKALQLELYGDGGSVRRSWSMPSRTQTDLGLTVPSLPKLLAPAALGSDTELTWSGLPEGSVALVWMKVGDFTLERVTSAPSARMVDLSVVGESLLPGAEGSWSVQAIGPASSVDAALVVLQDAALQSPTSWFLLESASQGFVYEPDGATSRRRSP